MATSGSVGTHFPDGSFLFRLRPPFPQTLDHFLDTSRFAPRPDHEAPPLQALARWERPDAGHVKRPDWHVSAVTRLPRRVDGWRGIICCDPSPSVPHQTWHA